MPSNMPKTALYRPVHGPEVEIKSHKEVRISIDDNQKLVPSVITTYLSKVQVVQTLGEARVEDIDNRRKTSTSSHIVCLCGNSSCTGSHYYWMSCNQCGLKFSPLDQTHMILVSCGCIFCRHCASRRNKEYCQSCRESTSQSEVKIDSDLPDASKEMFDNINYPLKMMASRNSFRNKQFIRYLEHLTNLERILEKKLQEMEKEASDGRTMIRNLESQIREKEKEVAKWEKLCAKHPN